MRSNRDVLRLLHDYAIMDSASTGYFAHGGLAGQHNRVVPSYTALATSVTSALVGRGLRIMESSIWVAVITGLQARAFFQ